MKEQNCHYPDVKNQAKKFINEKVIKAQSRTD